VPLVGGISAFFLNGRGDRRGHRDHGDQRRPPERLRLRLPLLASPDRRALRLLLVRGRAPWTVEGIVVAQRAHMLFAWCSLVWVAVTDLYSLPALDRCGARLEHVVSSGPPERGLHDRKV
jgi:hypothetical protein